MPTVPRPPAPEVWALCRVPREHLCYLRYTLEAYEGLCLPTTLPGREGLVRLLTTAEQRDDLAAVLDALAAEFPLQVERWGEGAP